MNPHHSSPHAPKKPAPAEEKILVSDILPPSTDEADFQVEITEPAERSEHGSGKRGRRPKIDLARGNGGHFWRKAVVASGLVILAAGGAFAGYAYSYTNQEIVEKNDQQGFFGQIQRIIDEDVEPLRGEEEDRINVLLLGQGGENHPGGTLTDTIMLVSIQPSTNKVAMISLPRDLVIPYYPDPTSNYVEYRKINYVMELGGIDFAKETITEITGLTVHYHLLIDFDGFKEVIDTLGGVDVMVENGFTDSQYPDYNYGYQTIQFTYGEDHMDGERALQYSRSRHGNNGEGSDFARARRQQLVIEAVREEVLSASTFLNPAKISGLLSDLGDHVSTDVEIWEMTRFAKLAENIDSEATINKVVDHSEGGLLRSEISSETGAYVLIPNAGLGNYSQVRSLAQNIFEAGEVMAEESVVSVQNGTTTTGLAATTAQRLQSAGLIVHGVGNAKVKGVPATVIYDLSGGTKPETQASLEKMLGAPVVQVTLPEAAAEDPAATEADAAESRIRLATEEPLANESQIDTAQLPENVDFVVVLGADESGA